jgi:hydrogenase-4 component F
VTLPVLLGCPLVGGLLLGLVRHAPVAAGLHLATAAATAVAVAVAGAPVWIAGATPAAPAWTLRLDALSALLAALIAGVQLLAAPAALDHLAAERGAGRLSPARAARFAPLFHLFVFTMLLAVTTDNVGVMWIAIEGTTLASVFLITLERSRASLEAGYKYLLICSVGIAVAFVGTVLVYHAGIRQFGETEHAFDWTRLVAIAPALAPRVLEVAFVFVLIGYGTKAGLVPMHTWLPDAHSEAPAPVSALMSGVLLAVGVYALLRFKTVVDLAAGPAFTGRLLLLLGLLSMLVAALSRWAPRSYKRMLAYSSVEHMGLACLGVAFGGFGGIGGALLHLVTHGLCKSALFVLAGRVLRRYGTAEVARVRGLRRVMPWTGAAFLAAILALLGLPPFGLFLSEFMILRAGFTGGHPWAAGAALALLVVAFGGTLRAVNRMLYGSPLEDDPAVERAPAALWPVAVSLVLLLGLGLGVPTGLADVLARAAAVVAPPGAGE